MRATADMSPPVAHIPVEQLQPGDEVEIGGLGMKGTLVEAPSGKKRVRVKVGEGELLATVANLVGVARHPATGPVPASSSPLTSRTATPSYYAEEHRVVDVRGHAAEEALDQVTAALDRATLEGAPSLRIIHGHGTGKLKATLRAYLRVSPYVAQARPGDRAEGGDGVTIVTIR